MQEQFGNYPYNTQTIQKIVNIINSNPQSVRIVLQYPKKYLSQSFSLTKYLQKYYRSNQNIINSNSNKSQLKSSQQTQAVDINNKDNLNKINNIATTSTISNNNKKQFYTLFDSMKKQCCTDVIGAQHIDYHLLIHFGQACFSEYNIQKSNHHNLINNNNKNNTKKHYYVFPTLDKKQQQYMKQSINLNININRSSSNKGISQFAQQLIKAQIKYILCQQKLYQYAKLYLDQEKLLEFNIQLLKLPYDANQQDQYFIFGYYASAINNENNQKDQANIKLTNNNNILVLLEEYPQNDNKLLSNIHLTLGSFSSNPKLFNQSRQQNPQIYVTSLQTLPIIQKSNVNYSKALMTRLAQIGQIQKYDTFGLLVSNAATDFNKKMIEKCKNILKRQNKKYLVFMMNNLNQVKLGNFPEVEVYVVISCYNNSCFSMKDFCRLVVTPMDLEVAFNDISISNYNFDLNHPLSTQNQNKQNQLKDEYERQKNKQHNLALSVQQKQQIMLANTIQTLDYYRGKQYKGLDFSEKKPVQKIKKGKIGLAEQYQPLPKQES